MNQPTSVDSTTSKPPSMRGSRSDQESSRNLDGDEQLLSSTPVETPTPSSDTDKTNVGVLGSSIFMAFHRSFTAIIYPANEDIRRSNANQAVPTPTSSQTITPVKDLQKCDAPPLSRTKSADTVSSDQSDEDQMSTNGVEWTLNQASMLSKQAETDEDDSTTTPQPVKIEKPSTRTRRRRWCLFGTILVLIAVASFLLFSQQQKRTNLTEKSEIAQSDTPPPALAATTTFPTAAPVTLPPSTAAPTAYLHRVVQFAALGDIPYNEDQHETLRQQMDDMDASLNITFVIHVGDIRFGGDYDNCDRSVYEDVAASLARSEVPVLIIKGDNDAWDCANYDEALQFWAETFVGFENKHWDLPFELVRHPNIPETYSFVYQDVLFFAVDVVGGSPHGEELEVWEAHLEAQIMWLLELIRSYDMGMGEHTGRVVIFGHADPKDSHSAFFKPLTRFMDEMDNSIPILFVNGDGHEWSYDPGFYDTSSLMRIMVRGEGAEPPTIFRVLASGDNLPIDLAFEYDRQL